MGLLLALAGVGMVAVSWIVTQHIPDEEHKFAQIHVGIADAEATGILRRDFGIDHNLSEASGWSCDCHDYEISIETDNGFVTATSFEWRRPSILDRLRRWLGL
jgi:hypothetical protein